MNQLYIILVVIGGVVLGLGLISGQLRRSYLSDAIAALLIGILLSPVALGILDPASWGDRTVIVEEAARLTLAVGLMGVALRLPKGYVTRHWRSLSVLLGLGMLLMWWASSLLIYWLLDLPFTVALLIGAIVTPTDPIVATSIVTGEIAHRNIPGRLRRLLSTESGINDGLAYPFVLLPILLSTRSQTETFVYWFTRVWLWEVGFAVLFGMLLGYVAGHCLQWAETKHTIDKKSFLAYTVALSLLILGATKLLGSDGILAVFVAGLVFDGMVSVSEKAEEERIQEAVDRFFTLPIFLLLGAVLPWQAWFELGWKGIVLALAVLLLRRLPGLLVLSPLIRELRSTSDALFLGWFGPIGIAALFYAHLSVHRTGNETVWTVSSLLICASILIHGISATPLSCLYGRHHGFVEQGSRGHTET